MGVEYRNLLLPRDRTFVAEPDRIRALVERLRAERWVFTPDNPAFAEELASQPRREFRATGGWAEPFVERAGSPKERWEKATAIPIPVDAAWIAALRDPRHAQADELALHFQVGADDSWVDVEMPYPLAYGEDEAGYHDILVYASRDFVWHGVGGDIHCACGANLAYEIARGTVAPIDVDWRVRSVCAACSRPWGGDTGGGEGVVFRFAVIVDCGKGWPVARNVGEAPDRGVLRSPYGAPAPPIAQAFLRVVEETIGTAFDAIPEFY